MYGIKAIGKKRGPKGFVTLTGGQRTFVARKENQRILPYYVATLCDYRKKKSYCEK